MAALPPIDHVVRCTVTGTMPGGIKWANVFHVRHGGAAAIDQATADAYATRFGQAWGEWGDALSSAVQQTKVSVVDLATDTGKEGVSTVARAGSRAGAMRPPNCAFVISWKTARRYRGGHARTYLPGCCDPEVDNTGTVSGAHQTLLNDDAAAFLAAIPLAGNAEMADAKLCVVHYRKNGLDLPVPLVDDVTAGLCRPVIGSQRRRLPG